MSLGLDDGTLVGSVNQFPLTDADARVSISQLLGICTQFYSLTKNATIKDWYWGQIDNSRLTFERLYATLDNPGTYTTFSDVRSAQYRTAYDSLDGLETAMRDNGITPLSTDLLDSAAALPRTGLDAATTTIDELSKSTGNAAKNLSTGLWPYLILGGLVLVVIVIGLVKV